MFMPVMQPPIIFAAMDVDWNGLMWLICSGLAAFFGARTPKKP